MNFDGINNEKFIEMEHKLTLIILMTFSLICGCRQETGTRETKQASEPVVTTRVSSITDAREISISGNIEGNRTIRLGFLVAGKVDFIAANEGQIISKGQLLSSLDPANYSMAKELADIQVSQVQDEYNRLKLMYDNNSLSESDFAKISYGLQQAKVQQKLHTKNLADTRLYSPIDGVMLKKLCEVGEIIGVGIPLFVISDIKKIKVSAYIPDNELHNIKIGQVAKVTVTSLNKTYEGKIIEVGSAADPASRAFLLKIEIDNPDLLIRPGMIAEIAVISGTKEENLAIPVEAIQHDFNDQSYVFVVDTTSNKAFRRNVSLGKIMNDKIAITSGLSENEIIVTGGQQKLIDGSTVSVQK